MHSHQHDRRGMKVSFDAAAMTRSDIPMYAKMLPTLQIIAQKVLFDEKLVSDILPKSQIVYISCTRSQWFSVYAMFETERRHKEHLKQGHKVRPIRFMKIQGPLRRPREVLGCDRGCHQEVGIHVLNRGTEMCTNVVVEN